MTRLSKQTFTEPSTVGPTPADTPLPGSPGDLSLDPTATLAGNNQYTPATLPKLGVIFLGRRRPGFDMDWGKAMEGRVRGWLGQQEQFTYFEPAEKAIDDASIRRVFSECTAQGVD